MIRWDEIVLDVLAIALISVGIGLWSIPAGVIAAGLLVLVLSLGVKARRGNLSSGPYKGREVDR